MVRVLADLKDLIIVFFAGLAVGWVLREVTGATARAQTLENVETWDMKELPNGSVRVEVHRRVSR